MPGGVIPEMFQSMVIQENSASEAGHAQPYTVDLIVLRSDELIQPLENPRVGGSIPPLATIATFLTFS
jgi:hypothetical protein